MFDVFDNIFGVGETRDVKSKFKFIPYNANPFEVAKYLKELFLDLGYEEEWLEKVAKNLCKLTDSSIC